MAEASVFLESLDQGQSSSVSSECGRWAFAVGNAQSRRHLCKLHQQLLGVDSPVLSPKWATSWVDL